MQTGRSAFTLVELLVSCAIILILASLIGAAVSAARTSQKISATRQLIDNLSTILTTHMASCDSQAVDMSGCPNGMSRNAYRAWFIRRNFITGDMPDRWTDVQFSGTAGAGDWTPLTASQRTYRSIFNSVPFATGTSWGTNTVTSGTWWAASLSGAECLFMIVMRGGIADCLDCGSLKTADIGDFDNDGNPEFLDAWGNPIGYILWPAAVQLPAGSGMNFFTTGSRRLDDPFVSGTTIRPSLGMRPLIYSSGPDGRNTLARGSEVATLNAGTAVGPWASGSNCGNWNAAPTSTAGVPGSFDADNITNLDTEARQ